MSKSVKRVQAALAAGGFAAEVRRMPDSTRTAADAAAACGCEVRQIVKSLVFQGKQSGALKLLLVSGADSVDLDRAAAVVGEPLERADPKAVRQVTGFAIGGVAPVGGLEPIDVWIDEKLLAEPLVWAAAGAPDAVFQADPQALARLANACAACLTS